MGLNECFVTILTVFIHLFILTVSQCLRSLNKDLFPTILPEFPQGDTGIHLSFAHVTRWLKNALVGWTNSPSILVLLLWEGMQFRESAWSSQLSVVRFPLGIRSFWDSDIRGNIRALTLQYLFMALLPRSLSLSLSGS